MCEEDTRGTFEPNSEKCTPAFCQTLHLMVAKFSFISPFLQFFEAATFGLVCLQT